jgi:hypothetical protein
LAKTKKKIDKVDLLEESEKAQFMKLPKVSLCIDTSQINIRLSHSVYNNLFNIKHIFDISKQKAAEYDREVNEHNILIKNDLESDAIFRGYVHRRIIHDERTWSYEHNYCILSGKYLYFYKEKEQILYTDCIHLKNVQVTYEQFRMSNLDSDSQSQEQ